jgi:hypothetical protein
MPQKLGYRTIGPEGGIMTRQTVQEYAAAIRPRYRTASRLHKGQILDEFCAATGFHRKAAIRLLRHPPRRRRRRPGRPRIYPRSLAAPLAQLWDLADRPCSKLLAAALPVLIEALERHGELRLEASARRQLLTLSPASIDRLLRPTRQRLGHQPQRTAARPNVIRQQVPVRTFGDWSHVTPGSLQGDLVLHCGESTAGFYLTTLVGVDVASSWTELEPVWGLTNRRVQAGVCRVRKRLPFPLREWHVDNGGEFLNHTLLGWCRQQQIRMTRGRGFRKNDQAYVEQRNWLAVRRIVGYDRYTSQAAYRTLQLLYEALRLQLNFFRPTRKLVHKQRLGARIRKRYDAPQTPYQRLLGSRTLTQQQRQALQQQFRKLNPADLNRQVQGCLDRLWGLRQKSITTRPRP